MKKIYTFLTINSIILSMILVLGMITLAKAEHTHPLVGWKLPVKAYCLDINDMENWFKSGIIQPSCVNIPNTPIEGVVKSVLKPIHFTKDYTFWLVQLEDRKYSIVLVPDPK